MEKFFQTIILNKVKGHDIVYVIPRLFLQTSFYAPFAVYCRI